MHNSTALKVRGMTEDTSICSSFLVKNFLHRVTRHKKPGEKVFFSHHILHNPHNLNIPFLLFCILYKSRPHKWPDILTFPCTFHRQCIHLHFFTIYNCNIRICLLRPDKPCNCQGKGIWLLFHLWHDHKHGMFPHNHRRTYIIELTFPWQYKAILLNPFVSDHQTQKCPMFTSKFFLSLFFVFRNTPIPPS